MITEKFDSLNLTWPFWAPGGNLIVCAVYASSRALHSLHAWQSRLCTSLYYGAALKAMKCNFSQMKGCVASILSICWQLRHRLMRMAVQNGPDSCQTPILLSYLKCLVCVKSTGSLHHTRRAQNSVLLEGPAANGPEMLA